MLRYRRSYSIASSHPYRSNQLLAPGWKVNSTFFSTTILKIIGTLQALFGVQQRGRKPRRAPSRRLYSFDYIRCFWLDTRSRIPHDGFVVLSIFGTFDFLLCTLSKDTAVYNQYLVFYDVITTNDVCVLKVNKSINISFNL